jgi:MFS family permease
VGALIALGFAAYTKTLGRGLLFFLILVMVPLATTEIGTDGWITGIMESFAHEKGFHAGWVLVYTSAIMVVLRFLAGPIVGALGPIGLLTVSAVAAAAGLYFLGTAVGSMIWVAATLYGFGKTFFWPTTLGVVAEQTPKGGALTLNAISGIGMLAVGVLGFPYLGVLQTQAQQAALTKSAEVSAAVPGIVKDGALQVLAPKDIFYVLSYNTVDAEKVKALTASLTPEQQTKATELLSSIEKNSTREALPLVARLPILMLVCYIALFVFFMTRGGYKPVSLNAAH